MRLTLRTLLAYLDDVLEPAQTKELGEKIAESSVATALVNRMREVMRRRRLSAPAVQGAGAGIDANRVGEYLDNTLSPEAVADIERVCLESDVHLAEVAACHQILTLVLGEPVDVPLESRERMYALGPSAPALEFDPPRQTPSSASRIPSVTEPNPARAAALSSSAGTNGVPASGPVEVQSVVEEYRTQGLPDYLRPETTWKSYLPYAALAAVLLLWGGLFYIDPPITPKRSPRERAQEDLVLAPPVGTEVPVSEELPGVATLTEADGGVPGPETLDAVERAERIAAAPPAGSAATTPRPATGPSSRPVPAPDSNLVSVDLGESGPMETSATPSPSASTTDDEPPLEAGDLRRPAPGKKPSPAAVAAVTSRPIDPDPLPVATLDGDPIPPAAVPTTAAAPGSTSSRPAPATAVASAAPASEDDDPLPMAETCRYISNSGVAIGADRQTGEWMVLARDRMIEPSDALAVPEPFDGEFEVGNRYRLLVPGGTTLLRLGSNPAAAHGWALIRGRFEVTTDGAADVTGQSAFSLQIRDRLWKIQMLAPDTRLCIAMIPREPQDYEEAFEGMTFRAAVVLERGAVRIVGDSTGEQLLENPGWLSLTPGVQFGSTDIADPKAVQVLERRPSWTFGLPASAGKNYAKLMEDKFYDRTTPVDQSVTGAVDDKRPLVSRLAVDCLAQLQAIPLLVDILHKTEHEESRRSAIFAIRAWLPEVEENRSVLRGELERRFTPGDADIIYRLLWGYGETHLRDADISRQLVEWLRHDQIAIRELAWLHISRLARRDLEYRPNASPGQRQAAVNRILNQLRGGGLLPKAG
jgi:hypothetical protein